LTGAARPTVLHHFSEDPSIERFVPHVPASNPTAPAAVWAIDGEHAPLYWFPRDCPRVTAWPRDETERPAFEAAFGTTARRVHAIEEGWFERFCQARLHRYDLPAAPFQPWAEASGQWIATVEVEPLGVEPVGDLLARHAEAGIELRVVRSLWALRDLAVDDRWDFSIVRWANVAPRP
jgi:hypothetical protein